MFEFDEGQITKTERVTSLQVLRQAKTKLVRQAEKSGSSGQGNKSIQAEIDRTRRLEIYRQEILECREEARVEAERDRELLTAILKTWGEMKQVRRASRFHSTPYKLLIHRLETDRAQEEEQRKVELEAEVREVLEEREEEYAAKRKVYEEELKKWKEVHRKRVCGGRLVTHFTGHTVIVFIKDHDYLAFQDGSSNSLRKGK